MGENFVGITDTGRERDNNEDIFIAQKGFSKHHVLACVIDGVGGYDGGEIAARLTREAILEQLARIPADQTAAMVAALAAANQKIFKEKEANRQFDKMACVVTLAIADLENNKFCYAHVGDTRLYLFRDKSLVKITNDHSTVGFLEESGRLTETAAMQHPKRNEVNKALGYEPSISLAKDFVDTGESPFLPGDMLLLCSDGLTDMIQSSKIIQILERKTNLKTKAAHLVDAANEAGGKDNITVVLVHNNKSPLKHAATKPLPIEKPEEPGIGIPPVEPVMLREAEPIPEEKPPVKSGRGGLVGMLTILCFVLAAALVWFYLKASGKEQEPKILMPPSKRPQSQAQLNLTDSLRLSPSRKTISLAAAHLISLTDSFYINQDTLRINGNGATLQGDSAFNGPAFVLGPACKFVLLDSLTFQNFEVGIHVKNKGLRLKQVRFVNCAVPVQLEQQLPANSLVSGVLSDNIFAYQDTLRKK
ncbi:MAG: protein phosphatase 2C domain-containing protein [Ferruginibacter sp.]|nr:protein phosphatase 2C domain-containing protein [Ferruginibacter sp.]